MCVFLRAVLRRVLLDLSGIATIVVQGQSTLNYINRVHAILRLLFLANFYRVLSFRTSLAFGSLRYVGA